MKKFGNVVVVQPAYNETVIAGDVICVKITHENSYYNLLISSGEGGEFISMDLFQIPSYVDLFSLIVDELKTSEPINHLTVLLTNMYIDKH